MDILLEKIYKVVLDFSSFRYTDQEVVSNYVMSTDYTEGSFTSYKEIQEWTSYTTGDVWGAKNDYCWFKTELVIPQRFVGKKVMYSISTRHKEGWDISNPQFLIYVNDKLTQGLDVNHKNTLLSLCMPIDSVYSIVMLGYSGLTEEQVVLESSIKVVDPLLDDFYYNLSNLFWALSLIDLADIKRAKLICQLIECVDLLDLRHIYSEEFYQGVEAANQLLIEQYYTYINKECPVVTTIGHTHIDVAWLWTIDQTKEKVIRSFSTVLELMEHYPDYRFMSSQPQLYEYVKEYEPSLFEKIKEKVAEGRWEVDGGMWLEADCNIPSGESLSRQFLYGTQFIKKEFNKKCTTLWLPDVFGYSAALPQLIKKSGLSYMMTSKLDWNNFNSMPHDTFFWRGIDGSEVLTHLVTTTNAASYHEDIYQKKEAKAQTTYNGRLNANQTKGTWTRYQDKLVSAETLQLFGFGDGGGGPTEEMLENYKRLKYGLPGLPRTEMDFQTNFFERMQAKADLSNYCHTWQGELYLEFHQGTYTSMAKNKLANRKAEFLYQNVEFIHSLAALLNTSHRYPSEEIYLNWKQILLYQFHDIIPGTSILEVYEETQKGYDKILSDGEMLITKAMDALVEGLHIPQNTCVVINTLSHKRTDLVSLTPKKEGIITAVVDTEGQRYPVYYAQNQRDCFFLGVDLPPKGLKCFELLYEESQGQLQGYSDSSNADDSGIIHEICNNYYHIQFNEAMEITSLYDMENKREMIKRNGRGNILQLFEDRPRRFDNWNIDATYKDKVYEINHIESVEMEENNPLYSVLGIKRHYGSSKIYQKIYLYHYQKRIDFCTDVDWHEHHVLLKAAFEVDLNSSEATYDIQYGNIKRATHNNTSWEEAQYEVCGHKWADISEAGYGVSLVNDCKYGYDIKDNCMRITLIKCGTYPNEEADQGYHHFTYSIYGHQQTWREAETVELAYNLNVPLLTYVVEKPIIESIIEPIIEPIIEDSKKTAQLSFISCAQHNIIIDTIKQAEEGAGTIIRLFENKNVRNSYHFKTHFRIKTVYLCDLVENQLQELVHQEDGFELEIKGYEVITLHVIFERDTTDED